MNSSDVGPDDAAPGDDLLADERSLKAWIDRFSSHVATLRYEDAAEMMDADVNSFSTWTDVVVGVDHFVKSSGARCGRR